MDKGNANKHRTSIKGSGLGRVTETQKWGQAKATGTIPANPSLATCRPPTKVGPSSRLTRLLAHAGTWPIVG